MKLLAIALVAGCAMTPPGDAELEQAGTTAFANDKPAFDFFVAKGLTPFQAAGIVGNLDQESGVNPASVQYGGGPGRGIAQWSVGGRWDTSNPNVLAYASQKGESATSLNLQLEFIWLELTTVGYGFNELKATTNVTDATIVFMSRYEICGTCASAQRVQYAKDVLAAYGQAPDYAAQYVSQSWPLATMPLTIKCGESVPATLVLKNMGTKTWDSSTKLGTTMPRDRASMFAGSDWDSPNRAAAISGTVAPGANGTFAFAFHGPTGAACVPGTYHEHFGLVQESTAWFTEPAEDQIEAMIQLVPGDGTTGGSDGSDGGTGGLGGGGGCSTGGGSGGLALVLFALIRSRGVKSVLGRAVQRR